MSDVIGIQSLTGFIRALRSVRLDDFSARRETRVTTGNAFSEMLEHILGLYEGVEALHSFIDESGAIFDCIPVEQQPSLRSSEGELPAAPDLPPLAPDSPAGAATTDDDRVDYPPNAELSPERRDAYGNVMHCPTGTIPMRRITLEDLTRFETLQDFFAKGPRAIARPPRMDEPASVSVTHRWAHAYQFVNNGGGHSHLNLWQPAIGANQTFSLSQHWYTAGSGTGLQTIECGWQVYPALYGDNRPHLFTYWTADGYNSTGCYNLTCSAFVQTSSTFAPGMALGPISVSGGTQYSIELAYWLTGGRWWLYFNGTAGSNAIGYYPIALYGGGPLASKATEIDYGGETTGTTSFPAMGSGAFANQGWQRAAYQRTIGYWPPTGGAMINANLSSSQGWPACYTAQVTMYAPPWSETLWYGGPGGSC